MSGIDMALPIGVIVIVIMVVAYNCFGKKPDFGRNDTAMKALKEMAMAYAWLERAHEHMRSGSVGEAGNTLLLYIGPSKRAIANLQAVMQRETLKVDGPAALFPKEPDQSNLDYWYSLCHRSYDLLDEAAMMITKQYDYYQAYLRLLIAHDIIRQMLHTPEIGGPCRFCKQEAAEKL